MEVAATTIGRTWLRMKIRMGYWLHNTKVKCDFRMKYLSYTKQNKDQGFTTKGSAYK
jgi:hypothetical protein